MQKQLRLFRLWSKDKSLKLGSKGSFDLPIQQKFSADGIHSLTDISDTNGVQIEVRYLDLYGDVEPQIKKKNEKKYSTSKAA